LAKDPVLPINTLTYCACIQVSRLILTPSLPPVLCDPLVAKAHYEKIEKEVEEGVRQSQTREKAFPPKSKTTSKTKAETSGTKGE
jgi:hypothetical protein